VRKEIGLVLTLHVVGGYEVCTVRAGSVRRKDRQENESRTDGGGWCLFTVNNNNNNNNTRCISTDVRDVCSRMFGSFCPTQHPDHLLCSLAHRGRTHIAST